MQEEIFPIVDEMGNIIGQASRSKCHDGSKLLHPVVHLHVFNSSGELYLQKRSSAKDIQPNLWDSSSAGHIDLGEAPVDAVVRETMEELSISISNPIFITKYIIETKQERELTYCYYTIYDGIIQIDGDEVSDGRFWSLDDIRNQLGSGLFTINFEQDFHKFLSSGLDGLSTSKKNIALICIGSNEDSENNLAICKQILSDNFPEIRYSSVDISSPYGNGHYKNDFHNQLALIYTDKKKEEIDMLLKSFEQKMGRKVQDKETGKVIIDIDLVVWNKIVVKPIDMARSYIQNLLHELTFD